MRRALAILKPKATSCMPVARTIQASQSPWTIVHAQLEHTVLHKQGCSAAKTLAVALNVWAASQIVSCSLVCAANSLHSMHLVFQYWCYGHLSCCSHLHKTEAHSMLGCSAYTVHTCAASDSSILCGIDGIDGMLNCCFATPGSLTLHMQRMTCIAFPCCAQPDGMSAFVRVQDCS